jgi:hypothetical protein
MNKKMDFRTRVRYKYLRLCVRWKRLFISLDRKMAIENHTITPYEEKAMRLWKILLRDENTQMAYNANGVRQIEKDNIFMILQSNSGSYYIMTLMDTTDMRRSLYELHIPVKHADVLADYFDDEMERRMRRVENNKRQMIESDIDTLLELEERDMVSRLEKKINKKQQELQA